MSKPVDLSCCECRSPLAHWGINGKEYCSVCLPADAVKAFTSTMPPAQSVRFKATLRRAGNKALAAKVAANTLPLLEGGENV